MASDYSRKAELIAEIDRARSRASAHRQEMQKEREQRPSVTDKAGASLSRNRYAWIIGATVIGFIVAKLPPRTKKVVVTRRGDYGNVGLENAGKAGFGLALLKIAIDVAKPVLMAWATKRLGEMVAVTKDVRHKVERVDRKT